MIFAFLLMIHMRHVHLLAHRGLVTATFIILAAALNMTWSVVGDRILPTVSSKVDATTLPNGWRVTPAGRRTPLAGDLPLGLVFSPDGKHLLVNTAGYHDQSVSAIDTGSEKLVQSVNIGKGWAGMCLDTATNTVFVSGGGAPAKSFLSRVARLVPEALDSLRRPVLRLSWSNGKLSLQPALGMPPPDFAAHDRLPACVDLEARNPASGPGAVASAALDFSEYDRVDPDTLNSILWQALKPGVPMPAPVRSVHLPR